MDTRSLGFFGIASRESARVFGRRHWRWFVAFRFLRWARVPVALLLVAVPISGLAVWLSRSGFHVDLGFRKPDIPVWVWFAVPASGLALLFFRNGFRLFFRNFLYRIGL